MKIGYARVSSLDQDLKAQIKALEDAGCEKIYHEKQSGIKERKELSSLLDYIREGDTLVVWKLDRLGRSLFDLFSTIQGLQEKKIEFVSITENIDTSTVTGKILFTFFALSAELELNFKKERIASARAVGRVGGRPKGLSDEAKKKAKDSSKMYIAKDGQGNYLYSIVDITQAIKISKRTLYQYLKYCGVETNRI